MTEMTVLPVHSIWLMSNIDRECHGFINPYGSQVQVSMGKAAHCTVLWLWLNTGIFLTHTYHTGV